MALKNWLLENQYLIDTGCAGALRLLVASPKRLNEPCLK